MRRLLVTGASGYLGEALCRVARNTWTVCGIGNRFCPDVPGIVSRCLDLTDSASLTSLFDSFAPQAVIHVAAASKPEGCQTQPEVTRAINVGVSEHIAKLCADRATALVFTSTDLVFDGNHAPYRETDPVGPVNHYGKQKVAAEKVVHRHWPDAAICRLPLLIGPGRARHASFFGHMRKRLQDASPLYLFVDEFRTPVDTTSAARGLLQAIEWPGKTIHLGGRRRLSRYEMGCMLAKHLKVSTAGIRAVHLAQAASNVPRAADVSLDSRLAFSLGYDPADIEAAL
jgi:dTDP-4-dehydrorhamnose reductase